MVDKKVDKELSAITKILEAFGDVGVERRQYVLEYVRERLKLPQSTASTKLNPQPVGQSNPTSVAAFVREKKPTNNYQKIAVLAYYMQKYENKDEFLLSDLVAANTKAKQTKIGNAARDLRDAKGKYGYITQGASPKSSQITTFGEDVVEALPDQDAVRALKKPIKKKSGKRSKKVSK